jgi:hypothetical protein
LFRLALALGRTVDELLDSISYEELALWGVYYSIEPFGEWRADVRSAQLAALTANINRDRKKRPQPFEIKDFMSFDNVAEKIAKAEPEAEGRPKGAHIKPELMAWLFAKGRKKNG